MEAPGSGGRGDGRGLRRSVSAPELPSYESSLDSLADHALGIDVTPCSVLHAHALHDDVARSLQQTLHDVQREIVAAVGAGVLHLGSGGGGSGADGADGGSQQRSDSQPGQVSAQQGGLSELAQAACSHWLGGKHGV